MSYAKDYAHSSVIYVGGLDRDITEDDLMCVFSQYGEIEFVDLKRGFCFIKYEDRRSTILAVDNFDGIKLGTRTIRVDYVKHYRGEIKK